MPGFPVTRAGVILAVADVDRSVAFYRDLMGFAVDARYDDPPYASLSRAGMRLSLAEQGHAAEDRPGVAMVAPPDPGQAAAVLVLEVADCLAVHGKLAARGAEMLAPPFSPPWGGHRFFVRDPDGYLVEVEQPA
jgi:glyoxylase I family protein